MKGATKTCLFLEQSTSSLSPSEAANSIAVSTISCVTAIPATIGNFLALFVFIRYRRLRSLPNILLMSLCLTDLLTGIIVQPLFAVRRLHEINTRGNICYIRLIYIFFANLCAGCSMLTVGLVTIDRCAAITTPYRYLSITSQGLYLFITGIVWCMWMVFVLLPFVGVLSMSQYFSGMTTIFVLTILTVLVSYAFIYRVVLKQRRKISVVHMVKESVTQEDEQQLPQCECKEIVPYELFAATRKGAVSEINIRKVESPETIKICQENDAPKLFRIQSFDETKLCPAHPTRVDGEQVFEQLRTRSQCSRRSLVANQDKKRTISKLRKLKKEHKQMNTIAIIIATLLMCYLPQISLLAIRAIYGDNRVFMLVDAWTDLLVYLNSSMNPLIYCIRNGEIRKALRCLFMRNRVN